MTIDYALRQPHKDGIILGETEDRPGGGPRVKGLHTIVGLIKSLEAFIKMSERLGYYSLLKNLPIYLCLFVF